MINPLQPLDSMRRMFHPAGSNRGFKGVARVLMVLWMMAGLVICAERTPDLSGHSHPHDPGHLFEAWHGSDVDTTPQGSSSPSSWHHSHVVKDFTSFDSDAPALVSAVCAHDDSAGFERVNALIPEPPVFETEGPPLI